MAFDIIRIKQHPVSTFFYALYLLAFIWLCFLAIEDAVKYHGDYSLVEEQGRITGFLLYYLLVILFIPYAVVSVIMIIFSSQQLYYKLMLISILASMALFVALMFSLHLLFGACFI